MAEVCLGDWVAGGSSTGRRGGVSWGGGVLGRCPHPAVFKQGPAADVTPVWGPGLSGRPLPTLTGGAADVYHLLSRVTDVTLKPARPLLRPGSPASHPLSRGKEVVTDYSCLEKESVRLFSGLPLLLPIC